MAILRRILGQDDELRPRYGSAGGGAATPSAAPSGGTEQATPVAGNFVNLQDYLRVNRSGADAMASKVVDPVEAAGQRADAAMAGPVIGSLGNAKAGLAGNVAATPVNTNVTMASAQRAQSQADDTARRAGLMGSTGGQQELLNQAYGGQRTQGEMNLDTALLGAAAGGRMAELSKKYSGLSGLVRGRNAVSTGYSWPSATSAYGVEEEEKRDESVPTREEARADAQQVRGKRRNPDEDEDERYYNPR